MSFGQPSGHGGLMSTWTWTKIGQSQNLIFFKIAAKLTGEEKNLPTIAFLVILEMYISFTAV